MKRKDIKRLIYKILLKNSLYFTSTSYDDNFDKAIDVIENYIQTNNGISYIEEFYKKLSLLFEEINAIIDRNDLVVYEDDIKQVVLTNNIYKTFFIDTILEINNSYFNLLEKPLLDISFSKTLLILSLIGLKSFLIYDKNTNEIIDRINVISIDNDNILILISKDDLNNINKEVDELKKYGYEVLNKENLKNSLMGFHFYRDIYYDITWPNFAIILVKKDINYDYNEIAFKINYFNMALNLLSISGINGDLKKNALYILHKNANKNSKISIKQIWHFYNEKINKCILCPNKSSSIICYYCSNKIANEISKILN